LDDVRADHARRAVREPEEAEEHVVEPWRRKLGHHRLREGVVWRLEDAEHDVVRPALPVSYANKEQRATRHVPELPDVVEAELGRPNADHAPERDKDRDDVRNHEHALRGDLPVFLDVPEPERRCGRRDRLGEAEVRVVQERELELVVLADRDERARRVEPVGEEEERDKVDERVRKFAPLPERDADLLPTNSGVALARWELWAGARLLKDDCNS
jgi:hypothetical protein